MDSPSTVDSGRDVRSGVPIAESARGRDLRLLLRARLEGHVPRREDEQEQD